MRQWITISIVLLFLLLAGCASDKKATEEAGPAASPKLGVIQEAAKLIDTAKSEGRSDGYRRAESLLRDALDADPRNDAVMAALAEVLVSDEAGPTGRWREARELFAQALQINPRNAQAARGLAQVIAYEAHATADQDTRSGEN
ncbi:MAG: tetratricopeptide repeat protein [Myxococcales bacterium]|nr:tetratricopeptide repeat protein [Myxococcales bacterium]